MIKKVLFLIFVQLISQTFSKSATNIDLSTPLPPSSGIKIDGTALSNQLGYSVGSAGDFNADGLADIIIGEPFADPPGRPGAGFAYVIYGKPGGLPLDINLVSGLTLSQGFKITGVASSDSFGYVVSYAGDINKDGIDDIIIGAPNHDRPSRNDAGIAFVIYGVRGGMAANIDLISGLPLSQGFTIFGDAGNNRLGGSVSFAGDVNNDGVDDIIVGAINGAGSSPPRSAAGAVYVIYGQAGGLPANIDLNAGLPLSQGVKINGRLASEQLGMSVGSAGDFNGDGISDIIVGGPRVSTTPASTGAAYVIYGRTGGFSAHIDLYAGLSISQGVQITGSSVGDRCGYSVALARDVNNDGVDDIIVGAKNADPTAGTDAGIVYVIYGKKGGLASHIDLTTDLTMDQGLKISGAKANDRFGNPVACVGDINHDGVMDIMMGAYYANPLSRATAGEAYLIYGKTGGFSAHIDLSTLSLSLSQGIQIIGGAPNNWLGYSMSFVGDLNSDGVDDMIVGAPTSASSTGAVYVIYSPFCFPDNCLECSGKSCLTCIEGYLPNPWDGKCYTKDTCPSGTWLTVTECLSESTKTLEVIQGSASQAAVVAASSISAINFMNPGGFLFAALADLLDYMKYMSIKYPPKLQYLLDQEQPGLISIEYISSAPSEMEDRITTYELPQNFEKYNIPSSFLVNFWSSLVSIVIIGLLILIVCLIAHLTKKYKVVNSKFNKLKEALRWNYLLGNFIGCYGPIAFYSSFELRTAKLQSALEILSFNICIAVNLAVIGVFVKIKLILKKISSEKNSSKKESLTENFKDYQISFESYKTDSPLQQNYFLISCFRLYLFYLILAYLFDYPLVQAIIINLQGLIFLLYLIISRPFKEKRDLIQSISLEFVLQIIHLSVLGLAIIDATQHIITDASVTFGEIIIICNSIFLVIGFIYLIIEVISMIITLVKIIKEKVSPSKAVPRVMTRHISVTSYPQNDSSELAVMNESHDFILPHQTPKLGRNTNIDNKLQKSRKKILSQNQKNSFNFPQTISNISRPKGSIDMDMLNVNHNLILPHQTPKLERNTNTGIDNKLQTFRKNVLPPDHNNSINFPQTISNISRPKGSIDMGMLNVNQNLILPHQTPKLERNTNTGIDNKLQTFREKVLSPDHNNSINFPQTISNISRPKGSIDMGMLNVSHDLILPHQTPVSHDLSVSTCGVTNEMAETFREWQPSTTNLDSKGLIAAEINTQYRYNDRLEAIRRRMLTSGGSHLSQLAQFLKEKKNTEISMLRGNTKLGPSSNSK